MDKSAKSAASRPRLAGSATTSTTRWVSPSSWRSGAPSHFCWSGRGRVVPGHRPTESQPGTHLAKGIPMRRWAACLAPAPGAAIRDATGGRHCPRQRPEGEPWVRPL